MDRQLPAGGKPCRWGQQQCSTGPSPAFPGCLDGRLRPGWPVFQDPLNSSTMHLCLTGALGTVEADQTSPSPVLYFLGVPGGRLDALAAILTSLTACLPCSPGASPRSTEGSTFSPAPCAQQAVAQWLSACVQGRSVLRCCRPCPQPALFN